MNSRKKTISKIVSDILFKDINKNVLTIMSTGIIATSLNANGPFITATNPLSSVSYPQQAAPSFGDLDGDGDLDALVGAWDGNLYYYKNNGTKKAPSFSSTTMLTGIPATYAGKTQMPAIGDIDNDGDFDVAIARQQAFGVNSTIIYYKNNGDGTFSSFSPTGLPTSTGDIWGTLTFSDVDQDGDQDLFMAHGKAGGLSYYENNGSGSFSSGSAPTGMPSGVSYPIFTFGDVDGDGDLDMFHGEFQKDEVKYYQNNGGSFSNVNVGTAFLGTSLTNISDSTSPWLMPNLVDIDDDGDLDLFIGDYAPAGNNRGILYRENNATSINSLSPIDNSTSISVYSNLTITFSAAVNVNSGNIYIKKTSDNSLVETIDVTSAQVTGSGTSTITINPNTTLENGTEYYILTDASTFINASSSSKISGISDTKFWSFTTDTVDSDASLAASAGVTEPVSLDTTVDTVGESVNLFDFTITDGGGGDALSTDVTQIVLNTSGTGDFSKVTWRLNGNDASNVTGIYNSGADTITFSGLSVSVADGASETYTVNGYFNDNTGVTEGQTFILSVDGDTDLTLDGSKTQMSGSNTAVTNNSGTTINVNATALSFSTQPSGSVSGNNLTTQPVVKAVDAFGNIDTDFTETITLTESSGGTLSGTSLAASSGIATFTAVNYTAISDQESFTITADDQSGVGSNLPSINANLITSDVIATKLIFSTQPIPLSIQNGVSTNLTTIPVVSAVDANNTIDTGYSTAITLSEVNGTGAATMSATGDTDGNAATISITPSSGVSTFASMQLTYTASGSSDENFNLQASSGGLSTANSSQMTATFDSVAPTISSISIPNSSMKIGDTVTATITVTSDSDDYTTGSGAITGTIGGFTLASLSKTNNTTYTATFTVTSGGTDVTSGSSIPVSFTLKDSAGNTSTSYTTAITQSSDLIDANKPTLSSVSISSNNTSSSKAKVGDVITLTFTSSETLSSTPTVNISGQSASVTNTSGNNYSATYTMQNSNSEGSIAFTIDFSDSAGNSGVQVTSVSDSSSVTFDKTAPTVTDGNISISGASGTSGAYKVGDTITATWNNTAGGDNNSDISSVTVDFSAFGGGSSVTASNSSGTYTATYTITSGSLDATNKNISITATDLTGNSTTTADTTNASIDSQAPTLTDGNISISGASGTSGAYKVGDTITATWNNTAGGDNNSDISNVTVNFSEFGGGSSVAASNSSGTYTATFAITEDGGGSIDATNRNISFTATDNAGNTTTTADTSNATVDNDSLALTDGNISISGASGTSGAYKVGDTITATWNNTAGGDNNSDTISSVTADFSEFGGGSSVVASNSSGTYTASYTIVSGSIDATNKNISITAVDNAGNSTTTVDSTNAIIDTQAASVTDGNITISGSTGNSGVFKIGDTLTLSWNNTAGGDNNSDTISSATADLSALGGANNAVLTNSSETWSTTYSITSSSVEGSSLNASISVVDNAGNSTTVSDTSNISIDSTTPTVVIATDKTSLKSGQTANITFTLSEDSTNFVVGDVSVVGGTLSALVKSGNVYTSTFTPTSGSTTNATIDINASKFTDISGNENSAAIQKVISIDTLIPTVTISSDKNSMILSDTAVISFTLSKDSSDFIKSDITVTGGTLSSFAQDSSNTKLYTATLTPDSSLTTSITLDVNASKFTDSVGNNNSAATQKSITVLPSVITYFPVLNATNAEIDGAIKLEFSENIQKGIGNIIIKKTSDDSIVETIDVTSSNIVIENLPSSNVTKPTVTINRTVNFDLNTSYYVTIDATAFKDSENNNYAGITNKTTWTFTSIDNHAPTITSNSGSASATIAVDENQTSVIDIDATDINSGQTLTYSLQGTDANSFDINSSTGVITFKTAPNYESKNSYSITVKVTDNGGGNLSDTQNLTVNINNINDNPIINIANSLTTNEDTAKDLVFTYTDEDGNTVTATQKTAPSKGSISISGTTITYTPSANENGNDSFILTLTDSNGYSVDKTVNVSITAIDDSPTITTDLSNQTQNEDGKGLVINLATSDIDSNASSATYTASSSNTNIAKAYIRNGKLIVVPISNANGAVTISVTTTVSGLSSTKTFTYTLTSVNDRPTISNIGDISHDQSSSAISKTISFDIWDDVDVTSLTASSSNTSLLANSSITVIKLSQTQGQIVYTISANNAGDTTVTIVAKDVENLEYKESFNISVKAANDAQCVENTNTALGFDTIKSSNAYQDSVTSSLNLVNSIDSICTSTITWTTSDTSVIDTSGAVTQGSEDKTITVTATIVKGEFSSKKIFLITVPKGTVTDAEAIGKLLFETIKEQNLTKYQITSKLNLVDSILGKTITWSSSNDNVISPYSGYVTRTSNDESVTLTATIGSETKNFALTVLKEESSDEQKVVKDKSMLTISSLLDKNIDADNIKYNLVKPLPSTGGNGSTITWATSNSACITVDGDVIRNALSDKYVTLTATITSNAQSDTKEFIFKVLQNKIETNQSTTFKNAVDTASGSQVTTTENGSDVTTQSSFDNSLLSSVEKVISQESVKSILEFVDKVVNVYLNTDGSAQSTLQNSNGQSSSMKVVSNGSTTSVDASGNIESTDNISNGSIKLQLNTDGTVKHEVVNTSASTTTTATSTIEGSSVESDKDGNVETTSEVKSNGTLYKIVVSTDNEGKTTTKYVTINTTTGDEVETKNVISPSTPYPSGNSATITEIDGQLYISTTVPLDGQIVIE